VIGSGLIRCSFSGEQSSPPKLQPFVLTQFRTQSRFALLLEWLGGNDIMARKTPEQLAQEFEGRKAKGLAKGGAAFWPNIIANAVLKLTQQRAEITPETLIEMIEREAPMLEVTVRSGAVEAVARLKQAIAKGS